ncbi:MAG: saccharopine dehydrogenase NADP-binding domain-containing protein [Armatimonadetes bacterium]|nr:saccharopine dehydrogenase NADP-binding domain-containing protein [Armatimonadota bacterium]
MKIMVLGGCGAMGTEATRDLVASNFFEEVVVGDVLEENAARLCSELGGSARPMKVDVTERAGLADAMKPFDLILNCTSYTFGLDITRAAIQARRSLLDLGGLYNTPRQLELDGEAREAGISVVLGMGATPGVTNLMARAAADRMDRVDEIHVHFATYRPIAPSPGLLQTVLDEFSPETRRFYYEDGRMVDVPPFTGEKGVAFDAPIGRVKTWFVPHSETHTLSRFIPGVRRVDVRGTWRPEIMSALQNWGQVGLLSSLPIRVGGADVAPRDILRSLFLGQPAWPGDDQWSFFLNVEVLGARGESRVQAIYNLSHPDGWTASATGRVTGIPASIGAQKLAAGEVARTGVMAPEVAFDPWSFFQDLARRNMAVREEILETRTNRKER